MGTEPVFVRYKFAADFYDAAALAIVIGCKSERATYA